MSAIVRCPKCAVGLKVPEGFLGKLVRCPRCREAVPTSAAVSSPAVMAAPAERPPEGVRERSAAPAAERTDAFSAEPPPPVPEPPRAERRERRAWDDDDDDRPRRRKKR